VTATGIDVLVAGGGVIGLGVAWRAATAGLRVRVCDPVLGTTPSGGRWASWAAAGMLAPVAEVHYGETALLALNLASASRWPGFAAELEEAAGMPVSYRRTGTLLIARDTDDNAALEDVYRYQLAAGLEVERLGSRACRQLEPRLSPRVRGGVHVAGDHQVDNRALWTALRAACERAGVSLTGEAVAELLVEGERVAGAVLASGERVAAATAVLAAGSWSGSIGGLPPGLLPPVRPVKGQLLHLRGPASPPLLERVLRGLDVYLVPRADGRLVVGATSEERGFDAVPTAGAVHDLLRDAIELLPDVAELAFSEVATGLRPASPDNAPLLGPSGLDGLVVATGHYRNGILLTPVTADAIAELLETGKVPELIAPFDPRRFDAARAGVGAGVTVGGSAGGGEAAAAGRAGGPGGGMTFAGKTTGGGTR
jgi:glycine oxidase